MIEGVQHVPQPADELRRRMPEDVAGVISARLASEEPLADSQCLNQLAQRFATVTRLDSFHITKTFINSLGSNYDLYWRDLDLLRPCLGIEHNTAVFDGIELDYAPLLYDALSALKVARMVPLVQDGGKALCVAETGNNFGQKTYNVSVARKLMKEISNEFMPSYAKRAVELLVEYDVIGGILQDYDMSSELEEFRAAWPAALAEYRDDLLLIAYLSDASAHSGYRLYHNLRYGSVEPAVRPEDAQLSFLFEPHLNGAVTLTKDRCAKLLPYLPAANRTRHLLAGERSPYAREADVFQESLERLGSMLRPGEWFDDPEDDISTDRVRFGPDNSLVISTRFEDRPDYQRRARYFTPGDGRVWCQVLDISSTIPMHSFANFPISYANYHHRDPEITRLQASHLYNMQYRAQDIGAPLKERDTWALIHRIEGFSYEDRSDPAA